MGGCSVQIFLSSLDDIRLNTIVCISRLWQLHAIRLTRPKTFVAASGASEVMFPCITSILYILSTNLRGVFVKMRLAANYDVQFIGFAYL